VKENRSGILNFLMNDDIKASLTLAAAVIIMALSACSRTRPIENAILKDKNSYFYTNIEQYPRNRAALPIGVFDSGTGGLAVLNDIVEYECTETGIRVFEKESFVYLADMANMPYGSYAMENNTGLLQEHIIKNVQFLTDRKYYQTADATEYMTDKLPAKAIVIACNTATAYGQENIRRFLKRANLDIILIGVIDAAATGAVNSLAADEDGTIAIMATDGTVRSGAYVTSIEKKIKELGRQGNIRIFQQAGIGIAEAIDENRDFIDRSAVQVREDYMGPSGNGKEGMLIDLEILDRYQFLMENGAILFEGSTDNLRNVQLNSVDNYVAYHVTSLMEQIRKTKNAPPLKTIVLGCTHYPFVERTFINHLDRLRNYTEDGKYVYREYMAEEIILVNPAVNVAGELHELLVKYDISGQDSHLNSEFYISVPNVTNNHVELRDDGSFTYGYKYGRRAGNIQEYVKRVPFNREVIPDDILYRLNQQVPSVYEMILFFNHNNQKTEYIPMEKRIFPTGNAREEYTGLPKMHFQLIE
jgi:glutamate racemase